MADGGGPARLLAPLALALVARVGGHRPRPRAPARRRRAGRSATETEPAHRDRRGRAHHHPAQPTGSTYTVKVNDTLGGIAEETGVSVETLLELNPDLDPQALVSGQKIKLRE